MDIVVETLKGLDLSDKEIDVYLAILELGSVPASVIGKRTGIVRSTTQYTCQQLTQKGLLRSITRGNTFLYSAESPEKLLYLLDQRKKDLELQEENVQRIIGELKKRMNPKILMPRVQFIEGEDNMISLYREMLDQKEPIYNAFLKQEEIAEKFGRFMDRQFIPQRIQRGVKAFVLLNDTSDGAHEVVETDKQSKRVTMLVPTKNYPFEADVNLYGNKVAFYSYRKNDLTGVIIENQYIRASMFSMFKMAWDYARMLPMNKKYKDIELPG